MLPDNRIGKLDKGGHYSWNSRVMLPDNRMITRTYYLIITKIIAKTICKDL